MNTLEGSLYSFLIDLCLRTINLDSFLKVYPKNNNKKKLKSVSTLFGVTRTLSVC